MNWRNVLLACGVLPSVAEAWAPHFEAECTEAAFSTGMAEIGDFVGQVLHESQLLTHLEENLNYSHAERIQAVWPSRFPRLEDAQPFVHNPEALANKVYGGRMGNTEPGDGWKFRGSGLIQVTGHDNFAALQRRTGLPLVDQPELLRRPGPEGLHVCIQWWEGNVPDAVLGNVVKETRIINGGAEGLTDRQRLIVACRRAITENA